MDENACQEGEVKDVGDTGYLQRELGQVLPLGLAKITELQPSDPITVLALWLYKYRELNPLPAGMTNISDVHDSTKYVPSSHMTVAEPAAMDEQRASSVQIVQNDEDDSDDFTEDSGYLGYLVEAEVHNETMPMLSNIGDLFDDDDLR
ncbi:uncharacterized protein LOC143285089 [Babylonia areolata]|uniref:uncharacterized protein LOC143285089 n=1 Tax=Babylonia areolata TaxID=304850 RepID=UPI003FD0927F